MHPKVAGLALGGKRAVKWGSDIVKRAANRACISRAVYPLSDRRRNKATDGPLVRRYPIGRCPGDIPYPSYPGFTRSMMRRMADQASSQAPLS